MNEARQLDFEGKSRPVTGNRVRDQLAAIMESDPDTQGDEDLLAAYWLQDYCGFGALASRTLRRIIRYYRKADIGRRRRELRDLYPYSADEEERRQKRGRGGPP